MHRIVHLKCGHCGTETELVDCEGKFQVGDETAGVSPCCSDRKFDVVYEHVNA